MVVKLQKDKNNIEDKFERLEKKYGELSVIHHIIPVFLLK
jgi:hypothetical protein